MNAKLSRSLRAALAILLGTSAAAMIGCNKPPLFHIIAHRDINESSTQYRIFVGGQQRGELPAGTQTFEFDATGHSGKSTKEMLPDNIEVQMPFVCGWEKATFSLVEPGSSEMESARSQHRGAPVHLWIYDIQPAQRVSVLVDNRGGSPLTLAVGEIQQPVAANRADRVSFPYAPTCDKAKQLRMNGNVLAEIQEKAGASGVPLPMLLDASTSRCYREEWANYDRPTPAETLPAGGHSKTIYRPRPLLTLPEAPDYFLIPLPAIVMSTSSIESRTALEEVPCRSGTK